MGEYHHNLGLGNDFLGMTPKAQAIKEKNWTSSKLNVLCIKRHQSKQCKINRVQRQPAEWEYIFANHLSDKVLLFRIHKELLQHDIPKNQRTQLKNGNRTDISPKMHKQPVST